jgi:hypothetical protein
MGSSHFYAMGLRRILGLMGTLLGVCFIVVAAVTGVFVGTRSTVMDGRWIAEKLVSANDVEGTTFECEGEISVGVAGAKFACVRSWPGARQKMWIRMTRDGTLEVVDNSEIQPAMRTGQDDGAGQAAKVAPKGED